MRLSNLSLDIDGVRQVLRCCSGTASPKYFISCGTARRECILSMSRNMVDPERLGLTIKNGFSIQVLMIPQLRLIETANKRSYESEGL